MADGTIVYTTGVFDMLHPGHLTILRRARELGDRLVVGVQEDSSVEAQKGTRPIMSTRERTTMLRALPFVDQVITYRNIDQRPLLRKLRPHVMVQGGDWHQTADRTKIVEYARRHGIRIVVLPYSKGISSTAIKERVFNSLSEARREKQLQFDLATQLSVTAVDHLYTYEASDPERTARVAERISSIGALLDPLTVADIGRGRSLVIDGTNRLEALRLLGARCAPVQHVRYLDRNSVKLRGNEHYIDAHPAQVLTLVAEAGVPLRIHQPTAGLQRFAADTLALIYADGAVHALPSTRNWVSNIERLNALVRSYKGQIPFRRKSEVGNLIGEAGVLVKFRAFTRSDLVVLISKRMVLESGITWHIPETAVVRFRVPLRKLKEGFDTRRDADRYIRGLVDGYQRRHSIRRYLSNVYICDEWEPSEC